MHRFKSAGIKWWQKPLVDSDGHFVPAELAVLALELAPGEQGLWMNSRGTDTGVADLLLSQQGGQPSFKPRRAPLPPFVSKALAGLYQSTGLTKGCPDLVIWNRDRETFRLVEVKCPHWDRPTSEQRLYIKAAADSGLTTSIVEWEFS